MNGHIFLVIVMKLKELDIKPCFIITKLRKGIVVCVCVCLYISLCVGVGVCRYISLCVDVCVRVYIYIFMSVSVLNGMG